MGRDMVNFFISFTVRTKAGFHLFKKPESQPPLLSAGVIAEWAIKAFLRHPLFFFGSYFRSHILIFLH